MTPGVTNPHLNSELTSSSGEQRLCEKRGVARQFFKEGLQIFRTGDSGAQTSEGQEVGGVVDELAILPENCVRLHIYEQHLLEQVSVDVEVVHELQSSISYELFEPSDFP